MRYVAIIALSMLGLVELMLRSVILLSLIITVFGFFVILSDDEGHLTKNFLFGAVHRLLEEGPEKTKQIQDLNRKISNLNAEKLELQSLLVESEK